MISKRQQCILRNAGPDDKYENRRGETGMRKPNANAPGPGKHPEDTKGEVIAAKLLSSVSELDQKSKEFEIKQTSQPPVEQSLVL